MFTKKIGFIFTLSLILLFSVMSVAQAAPPLETPPEDDTTTTTTTDTLNLDQDGEPVNLGCIVSGNCQPDDSEEPCDSDNPPEDCSTEPPPCDSDNPEDCSTEPPPCTSDNPEDCSTEPPPCDQDNPEDCSTEPPPCDSDNPEDCSTEPPPCDSDTGEECTSTEEPHKIAVLLGDYFGEDPGYLTEVHSGGWGWGVLVKVLQLGLSAEDLDMLLQSDTRGWGNIKKMMFDDSTGDELQTSGSNQEGPPGQLKKGNNTDGFATLAGPGGGKGNNGQGKGNKGENGKGVSGKPTDKSEGGNGNGKGKGGNNGGNGGGKGKGHGKNK